MRGVSPVFVRAKSVAWPLGGGIAVGPASLVLALYDSETRLFDVCGNGFVTNRVSR